MSSDAPLGWNRSFSPLTPDEPPAPVEPPRPQRSRASGIPLTIVVGLLVAQLFLFIGAMAGYRWWFDNHPPYQPQPVAARGDLAPDEKATIDVYNQARQSVVHITTLEKEPDQLGGNAQTVALGTGSGFIWSDEGFIVTNFHVVMRPDADLSHDPAHGIANTIQVTLDDQSTYPAKVWGTYPDKDLAVLKINGVARRKLVPILKGKSSDLQVGQKALAIGNPFGLDQTLTKGIVSALGRELESVTHRPIRNMIQTDAPINPGNSGGPLLDSAGLLIGVNTAIFSRSGSSAGIGFSIPVDDVRRIVEQLIKDRKITRAGIGVQIAQEQIAHRLSVAKGVVIVGVLDGSPAAQANLRPLHQTNGRWILGDVIVALDGKEIASNADLFASLEGHKPGDHVTLTILRDNKRMDVPVTLAAVE